MRWPGLAVHLAGRNLRRRPGQALLLLLTLTIATGVLGVAMSLYGSADGPWNRTWRATRGFHVSLTVYHPPDEPGDHALVAALRRRADRLATAPGVVAAGGPWTHLYGSIRVAGGNEDLTAEVRDPGPSQVDRPMVTIGRWLGQGGGVVLEGGLAATLRARAGDTVTIQGRPFPVRGVAQTVSRGRFPLSRPAQVWVTPETAGQLRALGMTEEGFELQLRLADPARAAEFVTAHRSLEEVPASSSVIPYLETWQQRRSESHSDIDILAGSLLAPPIAAASVTLLGRPEPPPLTATRVAIVAGVAVAVVLLGTVRPALQGIRQSTLRSLAAGPRPPRRPGRLAGLAARAGLPLPGVLGLRSAGRRPGRLLTNATGLALGVAMIVVALALRASLDLLDLQPPEPGHAASDAAVAVLYDQIRAVILGTAGLLLVLATINAWIVAAFAARDAARNQAVLRAVGATPRQTVVVLIVSQLVACAIAVAAGIPLGLGLWSLMDGGDLPAVRIPATSLVLLAAAVPVVFAAIVSVPAGLLARRPLAPQLAYE